MLRRRLFVERTHGRRVGAMIVSNSRPPLRRHGTKQWFFLALVSVVVLSQTTFVQGDTLALWKIVHDQCVPEYRAGDLESCINVDLTETEENGVAILKDQRGIAQILAIPTRRITGIEDPVLLTNEVPNYFAAAWSARKFVFESLGHQLSREAIGIAVNSQPRRTQDQLHLHIDCLDRNVAKALATYKDTLDPHWRLMTMPLNGRQYWATRLDSADLSTARPFKLLADGIKGAGANMGQYTIVVIGSFVADKPAFIVLADSAESGKGGHGEDLLDHDCTIAK